MSLLASVSLIETSSEIRRRDLMDISAIAEDLREQGYESYGGELLSPTYDVIEVYRASGGMILGREIAKEMDRQDRKRALDRQRSKLDRLAKNNRQHPRRGGVRTTTLGKVQG